LSATAPPASAATASRNFWIHANRPLSGAIHVAITSSDWVTVQAFHAAELAAGGRDNGLPGLRRWPPGPLLVLLVFKSGSHLERDPVKGWSFRFRTRALPGSTIGRLLGQLMGVYLDPIQRHATPGVLWWA
jgi:hypothetical protein